MRKKTLELFQGLARVDEIVYERLNLNDRRLSEHVEQIGDLAHEQARLADELRKQGNEAGALTTVLGLVGKVLREQENRIEALELEAEKGDSCWCGGTTDYSPSFAAGGYVREPARDEDRLRCAIEDKVVVEFTYTDRKGEQSCRLVSPYDLQVSSPSGFGSTYLIGFDHDREGIRQFRVERIEYVVAVADEPYREAQS